MTLRIAVVGAGFMGHLHAQTVSQTPTAQLSAIIDLDASKGQEVASELGTTHIGGVEEAIEKQVADAYVVALPDRHHVETSVTLLEAGLPLLVEKPMAHDLAGARRMAEAAERGNARLMIAQILRFDPRYVGAAKAVAEGQVGDVLHVSAGRIAVRDIGERMNGSSSVLFYLGVHDADAIQWVTGNTATRVYSRSVSKLMPSLGVQSEDAILSTVEFDDGSVGQLFNGWTRHADDPVTIDGRIEVFGTEGTVSVDVRDHGLHVFGSGGLQTPDALHWPEVNGRIRGDLAAEVQHFVHAVQTGDPFVLTPRDAMRAVALNDAILRSVESGKPEEVERV